MVPTWLAWAPRALGYLRSAVRGAKDVERLKLENDSLREQLTLRDALRAKSDALDDAKRENAALRSQVRELEAKADVQQHVVFEKNAVWIDEASGRSGPFCLTCYGTENQRLVRLTMNPPGNSGRQSAFCGACKTHVWLIDASKGPSTGLRQRHFSDWDE